MESFTAIVVALIGAAATILAVFLPTWLARRSSTAARPREFSLRTLRFIGMLHGAFLLGTVIFLVLSDNAVPYAFLLISCVAVVASGISFARGSRLYQATLGSLIGYFSASVVGLLFVGALINRDIGGIFTRGAPDVVLLWIGWIILWFILLRAALNSARLSSRALQEVASAKSPAVEPILTGASANKAPNPIGRADG